MCHVQTEPRNNNSSWLSTPINYSHWQQPSECQSNYDCIESMRHHILCRRLSLLLYKNGRGVGGGMMTVLWWHNITLIYTHTKKVHVRFRNNLDCVCVPLCVQCVRVILITFMYSIWFKYTAPPRPPWVNMSTCDTVLWVGLWAGRGKYRTRTRVVTHNSFSSRLMSTPEF